MKKHKTVERYYAVRIGRPVHGGTYWMLRPGTQVPDLFLSRAQAQAAIDERKPEQPTILRVAVSD